MREFQAFGCRWLAKQGVLNPDNQLWNPDGVVKTVVSKRDRVTLNTRPTGSTVSTSVQMNRLDSVGYGKHTVEFLGRFDQLDPVMCVGAWLLDDRPGQHSKELDFEWSQWGDPNRPDRIQLGYFINTTERVEGPHYPSNAFTQHRIELTHAPAWSAVSAWGYRAMDKRWINYAYGQFNVAFPVGSTLRAALWLTGGRQPLYPATYRGPSKVVVSNYSFEPLVSVVKTDDEVADTAGGRG